jgi:hypothetical protein
MVLTPGRRIHREVIHSQDWLNSYFSQDWLNSHFPVIPSSRHRALSGQPGDVKVAADLTQWAA